MAETRTKQSSKERLQEITSSIEIGIKELFESNKYAQYLRTMSRFHRYSWSNTLLIAMQRPDATLIAGFNKWRDSFGRTVKKGEKGIKIIAPTPYKVTEERQKLDPVTKAPILDSGGNIQTEQVEKQIPMFRVVSVFDISQTDGKPLPTLSDNLTGNVEKYDIFIESVRRCAPVPIAFEKMPENTDGYYHTKDKRIAIRAGMSERQSVSAVIHEVSHSLLHDRQANESEQAQAEETTQPIPKVDRRTEEIQAESISYAVCSYYGIETSENSFGYIASWSKGRELAELKTSLEVINKTSSQLITDIDRHFAEISKERSTDMASQEQDPDPEHLAYIIGERYFTLYEVTDGYDYSVYDMDYNLIDSGVFDNPDWRIQDVAKQLLSEEYINPLKDLGGLTPVDFNEVTEKADNVAMSKTAESNKHSDRAKGLHPAYPLPDPNISSRQISDFGYTAEELLPLTKERALELWNDGFAVYALYPDNTESAISSATELSSYDGYFGIEKDDWVHRKIAETAANLVTADTNNIKLEKEPLSYTRDFNQKKKSVLDTLKSISSERGVKEKSAPSKGAEMER